LGKWLVCCAWPYVNTVPHLGTFIHLLSADVFSRYLRLRGEEVVSVTGSDEHGTPIEVEAIKKGIPPKKLTDVYHNAICDLLKKYGIEFSNYTRTESPVHKGFVQSFFRKVYDNGFIFTMEVKLPYCGKCERFLPDRFVEGVCPHCGAEGARGDQCDSCGRVLDPVELKDGRCVFCGAPPSIKSQKHWFFDLPRFADQLKAYLESSPQLPDNTRNFCLRWIEEGLKPRALTRDNRWGIPSPFPSSEGKTIYVWLEALLGYVSATVEWAERIGKPNLWKNFWFDSNTKNIHFIGKDNIPFHGIIFPALLMASKEGYIMPWQISSTEFILFDGQKFSKSRRIGVWMDEALKLAEPDYWRFILISIRPEVKDASFSWKEFDSRINSDLNDVVGNFIHRTLTFIQTHFGGEVPKPSGFDEEDEKLIQEIEGSPKLVGSLLEQMKLRDALMAVVNLARFGNQYLSIKEPWHRVKDKPEETATCLYLSVQLVHSLSILLEPFMPFTASKLRRQLNLAEEAEQLSWENAGKLLINPDHKIGKPEPVFHKFNVSRNMK